MPLAGTHTSLGSNKKHNLERLCFFYLLKQQKKSNHRGWSLGLWVYSKSLEVFLRGIVEVLAVHPRCLSVLH